MSQFSAISHAIATSDVSLVTARNGGIPVVTDLYIAPDSSNIVTLEYDIGGTDTAIFQTNKTCHLDGCNIYFPYNSILQASAGGGTTTTVRVSGFVAEFGYRNTSGYANEATANNNTKYAILWTPPTTSSILSVHKVFVDAITASNHTADVGYCDDAAGANYVQISQQSDSTAHVWEDLGGFLLPAGKYLALRNVSSTAAAKTASAYFQGHIVK